MQTTQGPQKSKFLLQGRVRYFSKKGLCHIFTEAELPPKYAGQDDKEYRPWVCVLVSHDGQNSVWLQLCSSGFVDSETGKNVRPWIDRRHFDGGVYARTSYIFDEWYLVMNCNQVTQLSVGHLALSTAPSWEHPAYPIRLNAAGYEVLAGYLAGRLRGRRKWDCDVRTALVPGYATRNALATPHLGAPSTCCSPSLPIPQRVATAVVFMQSATRPPAQPQQQQHQQQRAVTVEGARVPVCDLKRTAGLTNLETHPLWQGKWCRFKAGCRLGAECRYMHRVCE